MIFKRTVKFNKEKLGARLRKDWLSDCKRYRIYWRKVAFGVAVSPGYYALRFTATGWDFVAEHRPYRTYKRAEQVCMVAAGIEIPKKQRQKRRPKANSVAASTTMTAIDLTLTTSEPPRKRGRPKGSKNRKPRSDKGKKRGPQNGDT